MFTTNKQQKIYQQQKIFYSKIVLNDVIKEFKDRFNTILAFNESKRKVNGKIGTENLFNKYNKEFATVELCEAWKPKPEKKQTVEQADI